MSARVIMWNSAFILQLTAQINEFNNTLVHKKFSPAKDNIFYIIHLCARAFVCVHVCARKCGFSMWVCIHLHVYTQHQGEHQLPVQQNWEHEQEQDDV